jgi:ABC-type transporter Mla subunit MlaD
MRRAFTVLLLLAATSALVVFGAGAGEAPGNPRYWVEMDNAFGLIGGADVKVAGVRAGQIKDFKIDEKTYRALVEIEITQKGFGDLRSDVFCESRPQSLIGEYFLDCLPGKADEKLKEGARIPVEQTASTVSVDLVNNIMRKPFRERFSIIIGELGAALTARGPELNETIRRANPALRETDKVLKTLGDQREIIRDLTANADKVVGELSGKRKEITRFVREARDTAEVSGERAEFIRGQFQRLPTFLRELRPTMERLGVAADAQGGALSTLSAQAPLLERFFDDLGPFSEASRPAFRTLADASRSGRVAVKLARPRITELAAFAKDLPELATNLAVTLEHLDNRDFAVEKDPRSPGGAGFTGFEAFLQYVFRQSQATNVYDANSYLLKVSLFLDNPCAQYTSAEQAKTDPVKERCRAWLGNNQPGITVPDPSATAQAEKKTTRTRTKRDKDADGKDDRTGQAVAPEASATPAPQQDAPLPGVDVPDDVQDLIDKIVPGVKGVGVGGRDPNPARDDALLDFLFGS